MQIREAKEFWSSAKKLKKNNYCCQLGDIEHTEWIDHFKLLYNVPLNTKPIIFTEPFVTIEYLDKDFTMVQLQQVLTKAKENKAPGPDRITYELFKYSSTDFLTVITKLINILYEKGQVPESFQRSIIFPLHKKGDLQFAGNYRGITKHIVLMVYY